MPVLAKLLTIFALIAAAMAAGYCARRMGLLRESAARVIMTLVATIGYPPVGFLAIWNLKLQASDAVLPVAGALQAACMMMLGLAVGRVIAKDRAEAGLFGLASGLANHGATLGGFVILLLFGEVGLARSSVYVLMFWPVVVLLGYPIARCRADGASRTPLWRLYVRNLLDVRSIGLLTGAAGILLSSFGVPRPEFIGRYGIVDIMVFVLVPVAYFAIGLRLHVSHVRQTWRLIAGLSVMRFGVSLGVGACILAATRLTPWPLTGLSRDVLIIQSFVPTAVLVVAIANMFDLRPRTASVLFVANTLIYLVLVLPWVLWAMG